MGDDEKKALLTRAAATLLSNAKTALADMARELEAARERFSRMAGGRAAYHDTLTVHVIDSADPGAAALMARMYVLYEKVFPLDSEREELDKLLALMARNHDRRLQSSGAPFREQWVVIEDPDGVIVAACNCITFGAAGAPDVAAVSDGTQHLSYGFVDPRFRVFGLGGLALERARAEGRGFIAGVTGKDAGAVRMIQFGEQNAPLKMPPEAILVDIAGSQTDPFWRRHYFEGLGFRELGHDYIQLPLKPRSAGGEACLGLDLIVRGGPEGSLPAEVARFHLYNFFDRSVAAGQYDIAADADWTLQSAALRDGGLLPIRPRLDFMGVKERAWRAIEAVVHADAFDARAFCETPVGALMGVFEVPVRDEG